MTFDLRDHMTPVEEDLDDRVRAHERRLSRLEDLEHARCVAKPEPEVQPEQATPPTEREITQHQIDVLLTGLDVLAARLIEQATTRPGARHFSADVAPLCDLQLAVHPRLGGKGFTAEWLLEIGDHTSLEVVIDVRPDDLVKCGARRGWDSLRAKIDSHLNATRMLLAFDADATRIHPPDARDMRSADHATNQADRSAR